MAVVEIAKIQVRRGDARSIGMPQLDTGELGWAVSGTQPNSVVPELYVGNKTADGAPATANIRILTTNDLNIFSGSSVSNSSIIYDGNKGEPGGTGATITTGDVGTNITRTVKAKLNDLVHGSDFGIYAEDDSITTTVALQRALDQLYLNSDKYDAGARAILVLAQGNYNLSDTIYVPSYATILGAGKDKTILTFAGSSIPLFQYIDGSSTTGNRIKIDSVGGMNSNTAPRNITIKGLTAQMAYGISPDSLAPIIRADCASDSDIIEVAFRGRPDVGYSTTNLASAGIEIRGSSGVSSRGLRIRDCTFVQLNCGIKSDYDIEDTIIESNRFQNLYRGIVYGKSLAAGNQTGPKRSKISKNVFYIIAKEAISIEPVDLLVNTDHITSQNTFYNVGNNGLTTSTNITGDLGGQVTEVIKFGTFGNVSDNDYFDRNIQMNSTATLATFISPISGHASIVDNKVRVKSLVSSASTGTFLRLAGGGTITNINIQYHMTFSGISRWGNLFIAMAQGQVADITDNYRALGSNDGGIGFNAYYDSGRNIINVVYAGNSLTGQITYQINQYY
jgi:hypothetical protein